MLLRQSRLLVVDDEVSLRRVLRTSLSANGFAVEEARDGEEALGTVRGHAFDLVLLDINMSGMSGIDVCRKIRDLSPQSGIVMMSVRELEDDQVRALDAGADDYVTKPFKLRELTARLQAVLRRTDPRKYEPETLQAGNLTIDFRKRRLWRGEEDIHLSPKEFDLLALMMMQPDIVLTHVKLLRAIWGPEYGGELEYLRTYVRALRKKIEKDPTNPEYILTEPWVGYRFHNPPVPHPRPVATDERVRG